jgi:hypothetical protein
MVHPLTHQAILFLPLLKVIGLYHPLECVTNPK